MREIDVSVITREVSRLCIEANKVLPDDLCGIISDSAKVETMPLALSVMGDICENLNAAKQLNLPICQDTGMAVVFAEIGQDVHITGGSFEKAVNDGVADGYTNGKLRLSVVSDPLKRVNSGSNTPAIIHTELTDGDRIKLTVAPKGFGSENMSKIKMFTPTSSAEDIIDFVVESVITAGGNPCPPLVLGIGIGGDFEKCAILAKKALCRPVSQHNEDPFYAELEQKILARVNETGIGPQGFGGHATALSVAVETFGTHIAGLPVAINVGCHVTRHASCVL